MKKHESLDFISKFPIDESRLPIIKLKLLNALGLPESDFDAHPMLKAPGPVKLTLTLYTILYIAKSLSAKNNVQYLLSHSARDRALAVLEATNKADETIGRIMAEELQGVPEVDKILAGWYDEL